MIGGEHLMLETLGGEPGAHRTGAGGCLDGAGGGGSGGRRLVFDTRLDLAAGTAATGIGIPSNSSGKTPPTASAAWCSGCFINPLKPYMRVTL